MPTTRHYHVLCQLQCTLTSRTGIRHFEFTYNLVHDATGGTNQRINLAIYGTNEEVPILLFQLFRCAEQRPHIWDALSRTNTSSESCEE